jgi:hypothetical protein
LKSLRIKAGGAGEGRKQFCFEKRAAPALRERKNFKFQYIRIVAGVSHLWQRRGNKSFLLLFFKKEVLAFACLFSSDCPDYTPARSMRW